MNFPQCIIHYMRARAAHVDAEIFGENKTFTKSRSKTDLFYEDMVRSKKQIRDLAADASHEDYLNILEMIKAVKLVQSAGIINDVELRALRGGLVEYKEGYEEAQRKAEDKRIASQLPPDYDLGDLMVAWHARKLPEMPPWHGLNLPTPPPKG